jgi:hypothetical protein
MIIGSRGSVAPTEIAYAFTRNPIPGPTPTPTPTPGPFVPTEDTLEDEILFETDRGIIGRPVNDGSFNNASTPHQNGQPGTDQYYTTISVGENRSMGRPPKDKTWTNVSFGFMP